MNDVPEHEAAQHYPLFLNLDGRDVLVIGGNDVAARKVARLLKSGARVQVAAGQLDGRLSRWLERGRIAWIGTQAPVEALGKYWLVVVAEAEPFERARLRRAADRARVWINMVDDPAHCSAIVPAVVDRAPLQVAIGTGGRAPELARMIRSRIDAMLPAGVDALAGLAGRFQGAIRQRFPVIARRRRFLDWMFNGTPADRIAAGDTDQARAEIEQALSNGRFETRGRVALVGAGPGDPELLTLKALDRIQQADTIVHDGLVDRRILDYARRDAAIIDVSKRPGSCRRGQHRINHLLVEHASKGERVVRLKGGDPMVFGRGGEELEHLRRHGIDYEVVPGITAAVACGAYAGIPLTHRDHAQAVRLVTAHCKSSVDRLDWPGLAADRQTLALYMGVGRLEQVQQQLLIHGRAPDTPVALVENGTRPDQRVITGRLEHLAELGRSHKLASPAMIFVGTVAGLAGQLAWFGRPPCYGAPAAAPPTLNPPRRQAANF